MRRASVVAMSPVELRIPASSAYVVLARTAVAALGARLDFTLDRLDDLRLAVDEAAGLLLADADPGSDLLVHLTPYEDGTGLEVVVAGTAARPHPPETRGFAWTVLAALVDEATSTVDGTSVRIVLRTTREQVVDA